MTLDKPTDPRGTEPNEPLTLAGAAVREVGMSRFHDYARLNGYWNALAAAALAVHYIKELPASTDPTLVLDSLDAFRCL